MDLLERTAFLRTLAEYAREARMGDGRLLLVSGESGMGKTALLEYLSARVAGWQVARAVGVESEMELAYAGLHQLCAPMLEHVDRLPAPQRDALAIVFGRTAGPAPDRFLVGLATLTLLAEVAEAQPLFCAVEDAQWLDQPSCAVLAFVARLLAAEPALMLIAVRDGFPNPFDEAGLTELRLHGVRKLLPSGITLEEIGTLSDRLKHVVQIVNQALER